MKKKILRELINPLLIVVFGVVLTFTINQSHGQFITQKDLSPLLTKIEANEKFVSLSESNIYKTEISALYSQIKALNGNVSIILNHMISGGLKVVKVTPEHKPQSTIVSN